MVQHHEDETISGKVSFLTEKKWEQELGDILGDLRDQTAEGVRQPTHLRQIARASWEKVWSCSVPGH